MHGQPLLTPAVILRAYAQGIFPMAERRNDPSLFWVSPEMRGIIPLDGFHLPKRLARTVRGDRFEVTADTAFAEVMKACAEPAPDRPESWINDEILRLYTALHTSGHAHSIECRREGQLVGGLYGVKLGGAFFGESMFSRERDASKVALVHLVARLRRGGFSLLDTQFLTAHLARFGTVEIPRDDYHALLARAISHEAEFYWPASSGSSGIASSAPALGDTGLASVLAGETLATTPGSLVLQWITQTS
ncbi:MAG TPA: leucyl/phenylalanyl-tRNA--protein transferase [Rhizomicrobium sp.]|nr:leucyl/phenylalanyl-tRNA--protein transferase [Rhizomicrobium sp.]